MARRLRLPVLAVVLTLAAAFWLFRGGGAEPEPSAVAAADPMTAPREAGAWSDPAALQRSSAAAPGADEETVRASRLRLRAFDGAGRPAAGALVAQLDFSVEPPALRGVHEMDAHGEAEVGAWSADIAAATRWVASYPNHAPLLVPAAAAPGVQDLQFSAAAMLAGRVLVDGAAPGAPLRVAVRGFRDPAADWPPAARDILAQWGLGSGAAPLFVAPDGHFALRGFPEGDLLELTFPAGFVLREDPARRHPARVSAPTPARDLLIELSRLPAIRGTLMRRVEDAVIVAAEAGQLQFPAFPSMLMKLEWSLWRGAESEEDGAWISSGHSFLIPLTAPAPDRAELRVLDHDGTLLSRRAVPGPLQDGAELGTWTVPDAVRPLDLTVLDESGQPIAHALAVAHRAVLGRTGSDGRIRLDLRAPPGTLTIGAFGFRLQRVPVAEPAPAELTVRLLPASRLRLEVTTPDGSPAQGLMAVLSYGEGLIPDSPEAVPGFEAVRGPPSGGAIWSEGWREHHYPLPDGSAEWSDLSGGAPLTLQVRDLYDTLLHEEQILLGDAETRLVRVLLPRAGRAITGRLLTPEGNPIAGGHASPGGMFQEATADAEGRFRFDHFYGESPSLMLWAEGRVSRTTQPAEFADGRDWILEPARTVWIVALDARGARCGAGRGPLLELDGGWQGAGQERGPGLYEVSGAPLRPGTVTVPGTAVAPVRIGAEQTEATVTVPD